MPKKTIDGKDFVTVKEAAEELQVSTATIRRLCDDEKLDAVQHKITNYRYISAESVKKLKRNLWD